MKQRMISCLLLIAVCITLLSGCGTTADQPTRDFKQIEYSVSMESDSSHPTDDIGTDEPKILDEGFSVEGLELSASEQAGPEPAETVATGAVEQSALESDELTSANAFLLSSIAPYSGKAYVAVNGNIPFFAVDDLTTSSFEMYSDLDALGRCGTVYASIGQDLMPTEERGAIGMVKPSGWHTVKYDCVDGKYLYNRCHLIGYQLSGENANTSNLITGTRYLNIEGMLPFENMVADYVKETNNHVMYRVTPIFEGENLLASGVLMEGYSVEDNGAGICYCIYAYNIQPGVDIDYATGESKLAVDDQFEQTPVVVAPDPTPVPAPEENKEKEPASGSQHTQVTYILNINTKKFHMPSCSSVDDMKEKNKQEFFGTRDEAIDQGYSPCGRCKP